MKFVVRLLDDAGALLAWATVQASPRPQPSRVSCPWWPTEPTQFVIERDGLASAVTIHWCDLDIARMNRLMEPARVSAGQIFDFTWTEPVWLVSGMREVPLPPVTERHALAIGVPPAAIGVVAG